MPPSPDDSSQSMGACFAYCLDNNIETFPLENAYLGYEIEDVKVRIALKKLSKIDYRVSKKDIINKTVKLLLKDKTIGICNGKSEFGARALGNRSIVCNPQNIENIKKINEKVKNRDFWMPFAVSILKDHHKKYIINSKSLMSSHMTMGFDTHKKNLKNIISGTHPYDETVRPQILERNFNKRYYDLIKSFYKQTKIPALLNTSLNLHGKPTVSNLKQAIYTLRNSKLDCLVVNYKYIIKKN